METWTRTDGRFYCIELSADLFGPVVLVCFGGASRHGRCKTIPVFGNEDAEAVLARLRKRRVSHGYSV